MTEAASPGGEGQSIYKPCEKIFGYPHWQLHAPLYETLVAEKQAREVVSYFCNTLPSNSGDWKKHLEARFTSFYICIPHV